MAKENIFIGVTSSSAHSDYCRAVDHAGAVPVLIAPMGDKSLRKLIKTLDGIVFTGGSDVDPSYYGEPEHRYLGGVSKSRDAFEMNLYNMIHSETNIPILGVCRGAQLMNVAMGGTLYQDIDSQHPSHFHDGNEMSFSPVHLVKVDQSSTLGTILPEYTMVNSFHHQSVKDVGFGLRACAWAPDGVIEAVEYIDHRFRIGVQWHPEALYTRHSVFEEFFHRFVDACAMEVEFCPEQ